MNERDYDNERIIVRNTTRIREGHFVVIVLPQDVIDHFVITSVGRGK
jgi:mRNA-degrading endonuclease RelE of RelBE toxin-antitoxin system